MTNMNEQVEFAKLAGQAERYTDMVNAMKTVAESNSELTIEERNLLSIAYKNVIGTYRSPWRAISSIEQEANGTEQQQKLTTKYRQKIENELKVVCHELLTLIDKHLIPKATATESQVFYLKMKGDCYRYLAEVATDSERQKLAEESKHAYKNGFEIAIDQMAVTHPTRLGLVLNFSVFHYEILDETDVACRMAKEAFDAALAGLDYVSEDSYKDITLIMQLLRDNVTVSIHLFNYFLYNHLFLIKFHQIWTGNQSEFNDTDQPDEQ
ncbi:unnamed protein product [Adineta steineri]|uniref:14-3-3 domain-containing protein n=1 Tax=Adineta steineri TaxID=433720 RepID=A0A814MYB8_9BILA|nr:unnamed protein product [Adineta steineri]